MSRTGKFHLVIKAIGGVSANGTSLMFSNNATPEPMLKFGRVTPLHFDVVPLAWLGPIRNTAFVGALPDYHFLRGPYPDFPVVGNAYQTINPLPYTWGDRFLQSRTSGSRSGASVSVIWAGQGGLQRYKPGCTHLIATATFRRTIPANAIPASTCLTGCLTTSSPSMSKAWPTTSPIQSTQKDNRLGILDSISQSFLVYPSLICGLKAVYTNLIGYRGPRAVLPK